MRQNKGRLTFGQQLFAGAVAGISEIIVMYPLDVVKTRIQLQVGGNSPGFAMMLVDITKKEGILRLYRGIQAPILIEAPKRAIKFAANDQYTRFLWPHFQEYHILSYLPVTAGMLAGATEALAVVSMELVKVRMQDQLRVNEYRNFMHCIESIVRHEGVFALFKGLEATAWRHVVWNGGYFGSIPHFKQYLARFKVCELH
jgi:solute carrier family 25 2-oxodicarboxylate transporter 21